MAARGNTLEHEAENEDGCPLIAAFRDKRAFEWLRPSTTSLAYHRGDRTQGLSVLLDTNGHTPHGGHRRPNSGILQIVAAHSCYGPFDQFPAERPQSVNHATNKWC